MTAYPDLPSWRMAPDVDGTVGVLVDTVGVGTQMTLPQMVAMTGESGTRITIEYRPGRIAYVFPQLRDVAGVYVAAGAILGGYPLYLETSVDTTNGIDGTWTARGTMLNPDYTEGNTSVGPVIRPNYRQQVYPVSAPACSGVRLSWVDWGPSHDYLQYLSAFHVYGGIVAGQTPDRLALWDLTTDAQIAYTLLNWGEAPRGTTATKQFRVKNLSSTLTAHSIGLDMDVLSDSPTDSVLDQFTLSTDGTAWSSTITGLADLAPGAISAPLSIRRVITADMDLSVWAFRLHAAASSWS